MAESGLLTELRKLVAQRRADHEKVLESGPAGKRLALEQLLNATPQFFASITSAITELEHAKGAVLQELTQSKWEESKFLWQVGSQVFTARQKVKAAPLVLCYLHECVQQLKMILCEG